MYVGLPGAMSGRPVGVGAVAGVTPRRVEGRAAVPAGDDGARRRRCGRWAPRRSPRRRWGGERGVQCAACPGQELRDRRLTDPQLVGDLNEGGVSPVVGRDGKPLVVGKAGHGSGKVDTGDDVPDVIVRVGRDVPAGHRRAGPVSVTDGLVEGDGGHREGELAVVADAPVSAAKAVGDGRLDVATHPCSGAACTAPGAGSVPKAEEGIGLDLVQVAAPTGLRGAAAGDPEGEAPVALDERRDVLVSRAGAHQGSR